MLCSKYDVFLFKNYKRKIPLYEKHTRKDYQFPFSMNSRQIKCLALPKLNKSVITFQIVVILSSSKTDFSEPSYLAVNLRVAA